MDWKRVEENWKDMKGKIKEKWGKLTDDDLTVINGKREQLEGRIQQRYGYAKGPSQEGCGRLVQFTEVVSSLTLCKSPGLSPGLFCMEFGRLIKWQ